MLVLHVSHEGLDVYFNIKAISWVWKSEQKLSFIDLKFNSLA